MARPELRSLRRDRPPEVLAPAGGRPHLAAAIENGADAVYFGLTELNARARAANFLPAELPEIMAQLHERGVQGFVTLNTLVFDEELPLVERYGRLLLDAGVDAVIVQDLGLAATLRRVAPGLVLHGSTQMTVTSAESAALVARLGLERVVLARELSVKEIRAVAAASELELEVFVHGALCVSYSGQCFSSEAWGGRSANRGQCAQACRLPYDLVVDGDERDLGDVSYLLSPQDLAGVDLVPELVDAGVSCLKIEGRLKSPEYVALTTSTYREAVDAAWAGDRRELTPDARRDLQQVFSRGLTPGFLEGSKHQRLVSGRFPKHRGVAVGRVEDIDRRLVSVRLTGPVKAGDGLVFDAGRPQGDEVGGTVNAVVVDGAAMPGAVNSGRVGLRFGPKVALDRVQPGDRVWRTRDPALESRLRRSWSVRGARRVSVELRVSGSAGQPLTAVMTDPEGRRVESQSDCVLEPARGGGLSPESLGKSLGRMGDSPFELTDLHSVLPAGLFLPVSALNRLRRALCEDLAEQRRHGPLAPRRGELAPDIVSLAGSAAPPSSPAPTTERPPSLSVLCRSLEQVHAALELPDVEEVAVDFLEVRGLGDAIDAIQAAGRRAIAVSPRVLKPQEERLRAFLLKLGADAVLVRSLGLLHSLLELPREQRPALHGDFSLNATNQRSIALLLGAGLDRLTPGHDLNWRQLCALPTDDTAPYLQLVLHQHLPIFHTEHCVFARFLSDGNDKRDCGAPCEHHEVHVAGPDGKRHLVRADMGCRNTVFNADAQSGLRQAERFLDAGYRMFRIELVDHQPGAVAPLVSATLDALAGRISGKDAWNRVSEQGTYPLTAGSLAVVQLKAPLKAPGWKRDRSGPSSA